MGTAAEYKEFAMKRMVFSLGFVFLMGSLYAQIVSDFEIQGNDDGTMTILNYKGLAKDIVIPEKIFNMPVSRLREGAFKNKGLTSVSIPGAVTFIGDETFRQNQLATVTIPQTVEYIGNYAFANNRLANITIPGNVITIGNYAFADNSLASITIPDSVTFIGNNAFEGNRITNVVIGNGVVYIGSSAFTGSGDFSNDNQIATVTLGDSIKYIGDNAFYCHRISAVVIPENVVYIGGQAFQPRTRNSLTSITIGKYIMFGVNGYGNYGAFYDNGNFDIIYQNTDKRAGKYTLANGNWTYTP
jgi:hypothetical protein